LLPYEHGGDVYGRPGVTLDFSVNINPLGMPEGARRALLSHFEEFEHYPDPQCRALTAAIAQAHGVEPGMVLCGAGASDLLLRLCMHLKPRRALTMAPAFSEYERSAALFGGETRRFPLSESEGFSIPASIADAVSADTDILFLCSPNNPTGRLIDPSVLRRAAEKCRETGTYLVLDECFLDFTHGASMVPLLREYPHLLILRAFTKFYAMAGLRLGHLLCADAALLSEIGRCGQTWGVSVPAQIAGMAALAEENWAERTRTLIEQERDFMACALRELGLTVFPGDANFLLVKAEEPLFEPLLTRGVLVRSCENFPGLDGRFFRIGLKTRNLNETLLRAVKEVWNHG
jgi:threonine-phosphate decarboxylase